MNDYFFSKNLIDKLIYDEVVVCPREWCVQHQKEKSTYSMDIPGVKKENVEVTVRGRCLEVKWSRYGIQYTSILGLLNGARNVEAVLADGVLTIEAFVEQNEDNVKKIEVKSG